MSRNKIFLLWVVAAVLNCSNMPPASSGTVIPGRVSITLTKPANNTTLTAGNAFEFSTPEGMAYGVVGLFLGTIVPTENGLDVSKSNWWLGNRTGLSGYSPGKVLGNTVYLVKADKSDLNEAGGFQPQSGTYFWTVWGFDQYGNLLYSSESRTVTLP